MGRPELFMLKESPYGPVLLGAMALFALAGIVFAVARTDRGRIQRIAAEAMFAAGAGLMAILWIYRWRQVGHLPMQGMFEIFLAMGALVYPLFAFCRAFLGARLPWSACAVAFVLAFPAGWINRAGFSSAPRNLPPALQHWLFGPHVAVYILSYVIMTLAAAHAIAAIVLAAIAPKREGQGVRGKIAAESPPPAHPDLLAQAEGEARFDRVTFNLVRFGFPLLTLGLLLGSVWGKIAWGDWWNWDPKELLSLASWLAFVGYFHFRWLYPNRLRWVSAAWVVLGELLIVWTLLSSIVEKLAAGGMHSYAM